MPHYKINPTNFPELNANDIPLFTEFILFMLKEFSGYIDNKDHSFYAHNEEDSHWFTKQYLEAKNGKGIYADFFNKKKIAVS